MTLNIVCGWLVWQTVVHFPSYNVLYVIAVIHYKNNKTRVLVGVCCCSMCGTECWEASNTRTTGPEKECAFVSSPRWTCESNVSLPFHFYIYLYYTGLYWCLSFLVITLQSTGLYFTTLSIQEVCVSLYIPSVDLLTGLICFNPCLPDTELKAWPLVKLFLTFVTC